MNPGITDLNFYSIPVAARVLSVGNLADAAYRLAAVGGVGYIFINKREVISNGLPVTSKVEFLIILLIGLL